MSISWNLARFSDHGWIDERSGRQSHSVVWMAADKEDLSYGDPGQEVEMAGCKFVPALANVLTHLTSLAGSKKPARVTRFHSVRAPALSIHDYLSRIEKLFQCSHECFVLCLVYIDRIVKLHPEFTISPLCIHRLLVTAVMLAAKFFDDIYYSNAHYAYVGGVKTKEVNVLETQFLKLIDWNLHVSPQEYSQYWQHVYNAVQGKSSIGAPHRAPEPILDVPDRPEDSMMAVDTDKTQNGENEPGSPMNVG